MGSICCSRISKIVASIQGNVLGEEEKIPSAVIFAENTPYHYTLRVFHHIILELSSATLSSNVYHCILLVSLYVIYVILFVWYVYYIGLLVRFRV